MGYRLCGDNHRFRSQLFFPNDLSRPQNIHHQTPKRRGEQAKVCSSSNFTGIVMPSMVWISPLTDDATWCKHVAEVNIGFFGHLCVRKLRLQGNAHSTQVNSQELGDLVMILKMFCVPPFCSPFYHVLPITTPRRSGREGVREVQTWHRGEFHSACLPFFCVIRYPCFLL